MSLCHHNICISSLLLQSTVLVPVMPLWCLTWSKK